MQERHKNRLLYFNEQAYTTEKYVIPFISQHKAVTPECHVIEHIHNQERFMQLLPRFLKPGGVVFLAFPPWMMPFGGHQQICASKLSKLPFFHLLPKSLYRWVLKKNGESEGCIRALLEIKETGISLERFERILRAGEFITVSRNLFFINPNYEVKFHLRPRKAAPLLRNIPYLRDFYITAGYYLISAKP